MSIFGLAGGPLLGVFTLGMYFPWANSVVSGHFIRKVMQAKFFIVCMDLMQGAICGLFCSVIIMFWIGFGGMIIRAQGLMAYSRKSVTVEGCVIMLNETLTAILPTVETSTEALSILLFT